MELTFLHVLLGVLGVVLALILVFSGWNLLASARREVRDAERLDNAKAHGLDEPASLHPVIDYDRCSGCLACLDICPEGDLFGVQNKRAVMIEPARCIGHGVCVEACPTDAIKLVFGSEKRGVDLPETDAAFETARSGVHIIGELGGMGLIKNALKQGLDVVRHLELRMEPLNGNSRAEKDVAIIGAGPAGIATAVACRATGLSFRIIDQGAVGGAIANYPRHKLVMTEPVHLPLYGKLSARKVSKEELLDAFDHVLSSGRIMVHENVKALDIQGEDGAFTVVTNHGAFTAKKVVLATGKRGSPRRLEVPGEDLHKVTYRLADPEQYAERRVLVVGGGDSALETAAMLVEARCGIDVTLSYRGDAFKRCRQRNRDRIQDLAASGDVTLLMQSAVVEIQAEKVVLSTAEGEVTLPNDFVIINAGGTLPTAFLKQVGVSIKAHFGEAVEQDAGSDDGDSIWHWAIPFLYFASAIAIGALTTMGWEYYPLERADRIASPWHEWLRPSGLIGHGIGYAATLVMLGNFLYSARKRWGWFESLSLRRWMTLHTFFGLLAGALTAYHSAFQSNNLIATATSGAIAIVVITGLIGRYFYSLLPLQNGKMVDLKSLKQEQTRLLTRMQLLAAHASDPQRTQVAAQEATEFIPARNNLVELFTKMPAQAIRSRRQMREVSEMFSERTMREDFERNYMRQLRLRMQIVLYRPLRQLMMTWRFVHIVLACVLVALVATHIAVSLYLGFGWVLF